MLRLRDTCCALALIATLLLSSTSCRAANGVDDRRTLMQRLAEHWVAVQLADGSLPYGYDFLPDQAAEPKHSSWRYVVRQSAALYMLAAYYRFSGDARLREPSRRALLALRAHSLPIGKAPAQRWLEATRIESLPFGRWKLKTTLDRMGLLYQRSGPGLIVSPNGRYDSALAGATAMALLAELSYARASGDEGFADLRRGWLTALLDLRIPGGGFRENPTSIEDSDFYNGEAWFALAVYADVHRDDVPVADALARVDAAMIARYENAPKPGFQHWGAMAAAQRLATTADARFLAFLRIQTSAWLERFAPKLDEAGNNCADMEGAAAALGAFDRAGERDSALARRTRDWLVHESTKVSRLQIKAGQTRLPLGGDAWLSAPRMSDFAGTFLLGLHEPMVRLDVDFHCLSALLMLERDGLLARSD